MRPRLRDSCATDRSTTPGRALGQRDGGQVRVRCGDVRDRRGIHHVEVLEAEHAAPLVEHAPDRAGADRVEEAARGRAHVLLRADLLAGPQLRAGVRPHLRRGRELAQPLEALGQHLDVALVAQEAVVDRERRLGIGPVQPHRAARARLHREGGAADLAARRRARGRRTGRARPAGTSGSRRRPSPGPCRARARPRAPRSPRAAARSAPRRRLRRRGRRALRRPAAARPRRRGRCRCAAGSPASRRRSRETTTVSARSSRPPASAPTARPSSSSTRSASVSARMVRFSRARAGST